MMRVLVVDDERLARADLRRQLANHADVEVVGEAANAAEALLQIAALKPDLLLLDVQMPEASGFDLLAALEHAPEVIFTTAFDRYAMQAFEVNALDYLQKPIQAQRLATALQRAAQRLGQLTEQLAETRVQKLFIKDGERCWFVSLADIRLFESEGNYTRVYFDSERPLMLRSLNQLEQQLDPQQFFRANRRQLVNLQRIQHMELVDGGSMQLHLQDKMTIEVSRRRAAQLKSFATIAC